MTKGKGGDPRDFLNVFIVDILKIEYRFGTEKVFSSVSPEWEINPPSR